MTICSKQCTLILFVQTEGRVFSRPVFLGVYISLTLLKISDAPLKLQKPALNLWRSDKISDAPIKSLTLRENLWRSNKIKALWKPFQEGFKGPQDLIYQPWTSKLKSILLNTSLINTVNNHSQDKSLLTISKVDRVNAASLHENFNPDMIINAVFIWDYLWSTSMSKIYWNILTGSNLCFQYYYTFRGNR